MRLRSAPIGVITITAALFTGCAATMAPNAASPAPPLTATAERADLRGSPHVRFGVPADADPSDDYLVDRGVYVASYNARRGEPNWVAWRLTRDDLGTFHRADNFRADDQLPGDFKRIRPDDYQGSGYDRGHLCPSAHRTRDATANSLTFLMTNMVPQVHSLNAGPWKSAETYEREVVQKEGKEVYVVAGGIYDSNSGTIGGGAVAVPRASYRVTIVVERGQGPNDVTMATPVVAVEMPNDSSVKGHPWSEFRVSADQVERDSGYDFLAALPDDIEARLEGSAPVAPGE